MHAVGIDYSTKKVAIAHIPPKNSTALRPIASLALPVKSKDHDVNFQEVMKFSIQRMHELANDPFIRPDDLRVAIEMPIIGASGAGQTALRMAMVCGALYNVACGYFGPPNVRLVAVSSWKKAVCGKGNLDKEQVGLWLKQYEPDLYSVCSSDDEVDAFCLAIWAMDRW